MYHRSFWIFLACLCFLALGCGEDILDQSDLQKRGLTQAGTANTKSPKTPKVKTSAIKLPNARKNEPTVMTVGDALIPWSTFAQYYANRLRSLRKQGKIILPTRKKEMVARILNELLTLELTWQEASRRGLAASAKEVEDYLRKTILPRMGGDLQALSDRLEKRGHNLNSFRKNIRRSISSLKLMEAIASATASRLKTADLQAHWEKHQDRYRMPARLRFSHIVINRPRSGDPKDVAAVREKVKAIGKRLLAGESFDKLARELSSCPCKRVGGVVPPMLSGARGRMKQHPPIPSIVRRQLKKMSPGEIAPVLETPGGFDIIHLRAREKSLALPYAHVSQRVRVDLARVKTAEFLELFIARLRKKTLIVEIFSSEELVRAFEGNRLPSAPR